MKTEIEIANERILELESQVKKLSLNLPVIGSLPRGFEQRIEDIKNGYGLTDDEIICYIEYYLKCRMLARQ